MIKNISILGTGAMGSRIVKNLLQENYKICIYNRNKNNASELIELGADYYATPAQAVENADIVISMLSNDEAAKWVWLNSKSGALASMKKNAIAIESSTLSIACTNQLATAFIKQGIDFLDAPVLGSRPQAEGGALIYLVGGKRTTLDNVSSVLEKLSSAIHYIGENSSGATMKLAVNAFFGVQVSALCEVIGTLQKSGINKQQSIELFNQLPTTSPALQGIGTLISAENYQPFFPINLVEKDLSYMLNFANEVNAETPGISSTHRSFQLAIEHGFGSDNISGIAQIFI